MNIHCKYFFLLCTCVIFLSNISCEKKPSKKPFVEEYETYTKEEIQEISELSKKYPNNAFYHNQLGIYYGSHKKYDKAIKEFDIVIRLEPDNPASYTAKAWVYELMEDWQTAKKYTLEALVRNPENPVHYSYLAFLSRKLGDKKSSTELMLQACKKLDKLPDNAKVYNNKYGDVSTLDSLRAECGQLKK